MRRSLHAGWLRAGQGWRSVPVPWLCREASAWLPWAPTHRTNEHVPINLFPACSQSPWTSARHQPLSVLRLLLFQNECKD